MQDGGPAEFGAVEAMEVVWPSGAALRGEAPNHPQVHWLKTVVLSVVGKGATRSRKVGVGKMSDGREPSAVDVSKRLDDCRNQGRPSALGRAWEIPVYRPGGIRHIGSMIPTKAFRWNV
jgi:hypothetical protein